mmetsp:Transcript_20098/g.30100  ORF Transcript_20098/g.30100 Transcript_20098/m.30100 type:complete len:583 (+) Transcript_20098:41-1789(+)
MYTRIDAPRPRSHRSLLCLASVACLGLAGFAVFSVPQLKSALVRAPTRCASLAHRGTQISRSSSVKAAGYDGGIPLDPTLISADLPYNAKKEGFTNAIERASRNRDLKAVRLLEQARVEVMEKSANGGSFGKWEEERAAMALRRRQGQMDMSIKRREKEDQLVAEMKSQFNFDMEARDMYGMTVDMQRIVDRASDTLIESLVGPRFDEGPKLITMRKEIDPMPWWDTISEHGFDLRTIQVLKDKLQLGKVVVLMEDPSELMGANTDGLTIGRLGEFTDFHDAHLTFCISPTMRSEDSFRRLQDAQHYSGNDIVVISGDWGLPSDTESKRVRAVAKEHFFGGLNAVSFVMGPVKLVPEVGGEAYPLPQWLLDAGYKAAGNVAITGNSGTGKSSLNNALRGLKPRDTGAAAVGVKETTIDPHGYDYEPAGKDMRLWDLPGAGTPKFPLHSYMRKMGIKYFDEVIIASAGRFTETDLGLMDELRLHGIPFIALRTKVDLEIRNAMDDTGGNEMEVIQRIRDDIKKNSLLPDERIFMVSVRRPDDYDFRALQDYIINSLHRGVDVKLAKALNRKLEVQEYYNAVTG